MNKRELLERAIRAMSKVVSIDFPDTLAWGQWSRELARAAQYGWEEKVDELIRQVEKRAEK